MEKLFTIIRGNHGVTEEQIGIALRHHAFLPDAAVIGSFAALFAGGLATSGLIVGLTYRRSPESPQ